MAPPGAEVRQVVGGGTVGGAPGSRRRRSRCGPAAARAGPWPARPWTRSGRAARPSTRVRPRRRRRVWSRRVRLDQERLVGVEHAVADARHRPSLRIARSRLGSWALINTRPLYRSTARYSCTLYRIRTESNPDTIGRHRARHRPRARPARAVANGSGSPCCSCRRCSSPSTTPCSASPSRRSVRRSPRAPPSCCGSSTSTRSRWPGCWSRWARSATGSDAAGCC